MGQSRMPVNMDLAGIQDLGPPAAPSIGDMAVYVEGFS